jgi:hypothetical protein
MLLDDRNALSRGDIVSRHPVVLGLDAEAFGEFGYTAEAESFPTRESNIAEGLALAYNSIWVSLIP